MVMSLFSWVQVEMYMEMHKRGRCRKGLGGYIDCRFLEKLGKATTDNFQVGKARNIQRRPFYV